jgi:hypothetical protein
MRLWLGIILAIVISFGEAQTMEGQQKDDGLYLVVGSNRSKQATSKIYENMVGPGVDFSHKTTFGGRAITLDLLRCSIKGQRHLVVDARKFNPGEKKVIRAVYMELFPSIDEGKMGTSMGSKTNLYEELMCMPHALENLASHMGEGATVEIEHYPHSSAFEVQNYVKLVFSLRKLNPFHCFFVSRLYGIS